MKYVKIVLGASFVFSGFGSAVSASILYSVSFPDATPLYLMNQSAGTVGVLGPTGLSGIGDLTSDTRPGRGDVYGIRIDSNELLKIDPATGAATVAAILNSPDNVVSLALNPTNGKLYGSTSVGFDAAFESLYQIEPATGHCTFIGRIGFDYVYALGFSQTGQLYGIANTEANQLISISTATGNGSLIASMPLTEVYDLASRPEDGMMFLGESGGHHLWQVDVSNGSLTDVGAYSAGNPNIVGLAFSAVPEPGAIGLLALALPALALRRRRSEHR